MGDITREKVRGYRARRKRAQRYTAAFLAFATLVGCGVGWSLRQTGISATAEAFCGAQEHTHTQECYEKVLICGLEEGETLPTEAPHQHTDSCYEEKLVPACAQEEHAHTEGCYAMQRNLTCTAQEHTHSDACYTLTGGDLVCAAQEHTHSDGCKDAEGNIVCGLTEHSHGDGCYSPVEKVLSCTLQEHTHGDSCYGPAQKTLICGHAEHTHTAECMKNEKVLVCTLPTQQEPQEPHVHTDACYEEKLICGKTEHTHSELCFSNTAARETEEQWAAAAGNPGSGIWAIDLLGVASSQLGYEEVKENFILDENGAKKFYTRYGDSYGDPYGSWNGMFLAYCLKYAGVPEVVVPRRAGVAALLADMASSAHLKNPGEYDPQPGDIAVFGDRVGVIGEPGDPLTVICGNVDGKVAEIQVAAASVSKYIQVAVAGAGQNKDFVTLEGESTESVINLNEGHELTIVLKNKDGDTTTISESETNPSFAVNDKEAIGLELSFTFKDGELTSDKYKATYQIPKGVTPQTVTDGVVYEGDEKVGDFTIDENGLITITFNDKAINKTGNQYGTLRFAGTANIGEEEKSNGIKFDGAGTTTIEKREDKKNADFSVQKDANATYFRLSDDSQYAEMDYTITVSSRNGSEDLSLDFTDKLNKGIQGHESDKALTGQYKTGSFVLKKGDQTIDLSSDEGPKLEFTTGDDGPQFSVTGLGTLQAGESYTLTYTVQVPIDGVNAKQDSFLRNSVIHHNNQETYKDVTVKKLGKTGALSQDKQSITWTIKVDSPYGDVSDYQLWDSLPDGLTLKGDVTIKDAAGNVTNLTGDAAQNFFSNGAGYTFATGSNNPPYTITYVTDTGTLDGASHEYVNTVHLKEKENDFSADSKVVYNPNDWTTTKERITDTPSDDHPDVLTWRLHAVNSQVSKSFDIEEYLTAYQSGSYEQANADRHYIKYSELQEDLKKLTVKLSDGSTVTYEQPNGKATFTLEATPDSSDRVTSFKIHVVASDDSLLISEVTLDSYRSHFVTDGIAEGASCEYKNTAKVGGKDGRASFTYTNYPDFKKSVTTNPYDTSNPTKSEFKNVSDGRLWYTIQLSVDENQEYPFTIMDRPPENAVFNSNDWTEKMETDLPLKKTIEEGTDDNGRYLRITIDKESADSAIPKDGLKHGITLKYTLVIKDDPKWEEDMRTSVTYVNSASWGDKSDSCTATVTKYDADKIAKESVQCVDSNGKPINEVQYTILINPNAQDLDANSDTLTLQDKLTLPDGSSGQVVYSSINLYEYGGKSADDKLILGSPVECSPNYSDENPHTFSITVQDSHAYVLRYRVKITAFNPGTTSININNTATLGTNISSNKKYDMRTVTYGADLDSSEFTIVKQDTEWNRLKGAKFAVEMYDSDSDTWVRAFADDLVVDEFKTLYVAQTPADGKLGVNKLYRISESVAPAGYVRDATPQYILFYPYTKTAADGFSQATGGKGKAMYGAEELTLDKIITRSARENYTMYFTNAKAEYTYELPKTGGTGTKNFVLFGAFAMILAGCGMVVTRKKHYTGVYER